MMCRIGHRSKRLLTRCGLASTTLALALFAIHIAKSRSVGNPELASVPDAPSLKEMRAPATANSTYVVEPPPSPLPKPPRELSLSVSSGVSTLSSGATQRLTSADTPPSLKAAPANRCQNNSQALHGITEITNRGLQKIVRLGMEKELALLPAQLRSLIPDGKRVCFGADPKKCSNLEAVAKMSDADAWGTCLGYPYLLAPKDNNDPRVVNDDSRWDLKPEPASACIDGFELTDIQLGNLDIQCNQLECTAEAPVTSAGIKGNNFELTALKDNRPLLSLPPWKLGIIKPKDRGTPAKIRIKARLTDNPRQPVIFSADESSIRTAASVLEVELIKQLGAKAPPTRPGAESNEDIEALVNLIRRKSHDAGVANFVNRLIKQHAIPGLTATTNELMTEVIPGFNYDFSTRLVLPNVKDLAEAASVETAAQERFNAIQSAQSQLERAKDANQIALALNTLSSSVDGIKNLIPAYSKSRSPSHLSHLNTITRHLTETSALLGTLSQSAPPSQLPRLSSVKSNVDDTLKKSEDTRKNLETVIAKEDEELLLRVAAAKITDLRDSIEMHVNICLPCQSIQTTDSNNPKLGQTFEGDKKSYDVALQLGMSSLNEALKAMQKVDKLDFCMTGDRSITCEASHPEDAKDWLEFTAPPVASYDAAKKALRIDLPGVQLISKKGKTASYGVGHIKAHIIAQIENTPDGKIGLKVLDQDFKVNFVDDGSGNSWTRWGNFLVSTFEGVVESSLKESLEKKIANDAFGMRIENVKLGPQGLQAYVSIDDKKLGEMLK